MLIFPVSVAELQNELPLFEKSADHEICREDEVDN
jgi:hypothetical protein